MIQSFRVKGLWGSLDYEINGFHEDINILTGSNGTGKTTILKLMWYMMSGHVRQALLEVDFSEAELISSTGTVSLIKRRATHRDRRPNDRQTPIDGLVAEVHIKHLDGRNIFSLFPIPIAELSIYLNAEAPSSTIPSLFFPTFRRIEGGFSFSEGGEAAKLAEGFRDFAKRMTHKNHKLIAFADFDDVRGLVNELSSNIRVKLQPFEQTFTNFLSQYSNGSQKQINTNDLKKHLAELEKRREEMTRPLKKLSDLIDTFFFQKSVAVSDDLILGTSLNRVRVESLSAGEKNLLGFLVYAMSIPSGVMFIDEPELTLHTDWQRRLLPLLRELAHSTQFIIATHSSAIYTSFPDKDFWLNELNQKSNQ